MANTSNQQQAAPTMEQTLTQSEAFFLKYKKAIITVVVALVVIIAGAVLYKTYISEPNEQKASTAIAKGQEYFAQGLFEQALNGDSANFKGFAKLADEYSSTAAGNLANLYAGLCNAQLGKWDAAVKFLEDYDGADDQMISPAAEGALGNAYAHLNQLDKAVSHLKKAAEKADNNSLSPTFLIQAGEILESQGKNDEALKLYQTVATALHNLSDYDFSKVPDASNMIFGVVVAEWNPEITGALLEGCVSTLEKHGALPENIHVKTVPGSFELIYGAHQMTLNDGYDAVIILGCVIRGETPHFDYICQGVTEGIARLNATSNIPVVYGLLTTNDLQQAKDRAGGRLGNKGDECAVVAIKMAKF